jgi:hypothetical protein
VSEREQSGGGEDGTVLTVAVVLDGPAVPAWQARVVELLDQSSGLAVERLAWIGAARRATGRLRRWRGRLQRHVFAIDPDPCAPVALAPRESSRPPRLTLWLAESRPPRPGDEPLLVLRHGDLLEPVEDAFWRALLAGESCIRSELMAVDQAGGAHTLASTVSEIRPYSEAVSRSLALWKLAALVARSLERLPEQTAADGEARTATLEPASRPPAREWELLLGAAARAARAMLTRLCFRRPWSITVALGDDWPPTCAPGDSGLVRWGDAKMYADPFLFEHEGHHHLFCEEVPAGEANGVISHTELISDGSAAAPPAPVLRAAHHLSYPFVFARDGEIFMIPETSAAGRVELYRAAVFPTDWRLEAVLLEDLRAADATLLEHDGLLWLFASVAAPGASTLDELHLFWARELRGPWRAHPHNPVVSDVRCARPAGAIQRHGSRLIRPAQDCSRRYGWAISFRQIDVLSTSAYAEHEIDRLQPDTSEGARAVHTFSADGRFQAWDLRRREVRLRRRGGGL